MKWFLFIFIFLLFLSCSKDQEKERNLRTVPTTNNPNIIPEY